MQLNWRPDILFMKKTFTEKQTVLAKMYNCASYLRCPYYSNHKIWLLSITFSPKKYSQINFHILYLLIPYLFVTLKSKENLGYTLVSGVKRKCKEK